MKTIFDHIERVKAQPHHVRERVAFGAATVGAALVAVIWFFGVFSTGTFAIQDTSFAESTGAEQSNIAATEPSNTNYGIAGAAAAIPSSANTPAHIEIVDATSSTPAKQVEATVIPF